MAEYTFLTTWAVDAPIEAVWDAIFESEHWSEWWKGVEKVVELEPGDDDGVGSLQRYTWKSRLPYRLEFDMRTTRVERPHLIEGEAEGDLDGFGRWRLFDGRGTAVTYEDLALKFLYWPNARVTGENSISLRNCWKLELKAPNRQSQYSNVWLWVDKEGGALMKLEGYDWNGKLAKRFTVVSGQKIEDRWFLKQMRIEEFDPATGKQRARTYLEIMK